MTSAEVQQESSHGHPSLGQRGGNLERQSYLKTPADRLAALYDGSRFTDLTISFPGSTTILKVHRLVLAMSSPVFELMFFGPMAEGESLELPDDPPEAFEWLMSYIYRGNTKLPNIDTAIQVYYLANKYQIEDLCFLCSEYFCIRVDGNNLPLIYDISRILEDSALERKCNQVLANSTEVVLSSPDIGKLSRDGMRHLLEQPLFVQSEVTVFQGLLKWGTNQTLERCPESDSLSLRQILHPLLPMVRFLTMTVDEFVEHVLPLSILTSDEKCAILANIKQTDDVPVPGVCCSLVRERRVVFDPAKLFEVHVQAGVFESISTPELTQYRFNNKAEVTEPSSPNIHLSCEVGGSLRGYATFRILVLSDFHVTTNIYLNSIVFQTIIKELDSKKTTLLIKDSSGTVLREVRPQLKKGNATDSSVQILNMVFQEPLLLSSCEVYQVSLLTDRYIQYGMQRMFSRRYSNLTITGTVIDIANPFIYFWCFN